MSGLLDHEQLADLYLDCLDDIANLHARAALVDTATPFCKECGFVWPCKTARMVASVR